jgi:hypothetical protein
MLRLSLWVFRMLADSCDLPAHDLAMILPSILLTVSCVSRLLRSARSWSHHDAAAEPFGASAYWQTPAICPSMIKALQLVEFTSMAAMTFLFLRFVIQSQLIQLWQHISAGSATSAWYG